MLRTEICGFDIKDGPQSSIDSNQLQALYDLSKWHDMTHIVAQAIEKMDIQADAAVLEAFQKQQMLALFRHQRVQFELDRLCQVLEAAKIKYIPLKGAVLRNYYPEPWMRLSCDTDILVLQEDLPAAVECITQKLGYSKGTEGHHDCSMTSEGGVLLELHFDLIEESYYPAFSNVLSDVWSYAELKKGYEYQYELRDEFFYFYHIAHMAKHFESGGCGIRPFLDLWILDHRLEYDAEARKTLLERGNLCVFAQAAGRLANVWFSGEAHDDFLSLMETYVLFGGVYGNLKNGIAVKRSKTSQSKLQYLMRRLFPPYKMLRSKYPVLQKHFYLAPVFVVYRWVRWLFRGNHERTGAELVLNAGVSRSDVEVIAYLRNQLGLQ